MKLAIYPGSFDPVTYGHLEIISRASKLFDKLIVLVSVNPLKPSSFTIEERKQFLLESVEAEGLTNVEIDSNDGLLIDYFNKRNADVIVKGLRAMSDFEYEFQMAQANRNLYSEMETIFLTTNVQYSFISSTIVKDVLRHNGDVGHFVPASVLDKIYQFRR